MRFNTIKNLDIANGPGVRVSIFVQGCKFNCKGCFNPDTHDFDGGQVYTDETMGMILDMCDGDRIAGLSILGGEPLHPANIDDVTWLAKAFKRRYPNKTVWVWSGYTYEDYIWRQEIVDYIDVVVDGRFKEELRDLRLPYCGSSNQRVIDVKKTRMSGVVTTLD